MADQTHASAMSRYSASDDDGRGWEYLVLTCQPRESLAEVRRRVVEYAEYGRWELRRSALYTGGVRKYWLRRRMIRVKRTF
ncbi:hypothetical protein FEF26_03890 [Nesterenkonia salmonea]|uniref:Uncharacterized protein n=1 Tax=Nesterenkonia salmonea TaxID=1804987 RepID=A0A5R9BF87_9MICC|nr:DUF5703 family protein [Nesterenkonia salmonea]TLP98861.1 hypothetical protein FEF26_03890 [Nesterenkonia salmonea]